MPSLERSTAGAGAVNRRQTSLDREVYYDSDNVRKEVVTYKPMDSGKLGSSVSSKFKLSNEEMVKYKTSMSQLCSKMKNISNSSLIAQKQQELNHSEATQPLKREVMSQARRFNSQSLLTSKAPMDNGQPKSSSSSMLTKQDQLNGDVSDCKKSLNDIRDRIGSLQSLLAQSRTLTSSRQQLFADIPAKVPTSSKQPLITSKADITKKEHFATHRNDSYSRAMDDDSEKYQVKGQ